MKGVQNGLDNNTISLNLS